MLRFNKIDDNGNERNIEDRKENNKPDVRLVPVQGANKKWGYMLGVKYAGEWEVDLDGEWIIEPKYDKAWSFAGPSSDGSSSDGLSSNGLSSNGPSSAGVSSNNSSSDGLLIAQIKVDEEKSYLEYNSKITNIENLTNIEIKNLEKITDKDVIPREELGPNEEYPTDHDGVTYSGPNFIKTTKGAETYLISCEKARTNKITRTKEYFYRIFKDAWFDYNDVSEILAKVIYDRSPNWGKTRDKTMNDIIAETEVWLITDEDAKSGVSIKVNNRFTGEEDLLIPADLGNSPVNKKNQDLRQWIERIKKLLYGEDVLKKEPMNEQNEADLQKIAEDLRHKLIGRIKELLQTRDRLKRKPMNELNEADLQDNEEKLREYYGELWGENERTRSDWMGCYIPRTGTILIKIDRVDRAAALFRYPQDLLFQKVLLHEFIHAALDLCPRDADGKKISYHDEEWETEDPYGESFNEESIDNAIVLKLYKGTPDYRDVKGYIEMQPYYYRRAVELDKSKLLPLLRDLIAYKISAPVSTTSTVSP